MNIEDIADIESSMPISDDVMLALRPLLEHSLVGMFVIQDGKCVYANQYWSDFTGYSLDELDSVDMEQLVFPDEWETDADVLPKNLAGKTSARPIYQRMIKKDGSVGHVQAISSPAAVKGKPASISLFIDITATRILEKELQEHQIGLQTFLNSAPDAIISYTREGYCIFANLSAAQQLLSTPDRLMGKNLRELLENESYDLLLEIARDCMASLETKECSVLMKLPTGIRFLDIRVFPLTDETGDADAVMAIVRDDTQRHAAEEALRHSEERYRLLVDETPEYGIVGISVDGHILSWNQGAERIFGYSNNEMIGRHFEMLFTEEDQKNGKPQQEIEKAIKFGSWRYESERKRKDGARIAVVVSTAALRDKKGKLIGFSRIIRDITESKRLQNRMERKLKAEATVSTISSRFAQSSDVDLEANIAFALDQARQLLGAKHIGVFLRGNDPPGAGSMDKWGGPEVSQVFGRCGKTHCLDASWMRDQFSRRELIAMRSIKSLSKLNPQAYDHLERHRVSSLIAMPLRFKGLLIGNICACSKNREITWHKEYIMALRTIGETIAAAITHNSVDQERQKLERQLAQSQKMEAIGTLAGGIAHDFNNLLTPIVGYLSLMKSEITEEHPFYQYINTMEASSSRAADIVRQLLGFARRGKFQTNEIDINDLIEKSVSLIRETFPRNITINTSLEPELWPISGDHTQIEQILLNLCINAKEALGEKGTISISTSNHVLEKNIRKEYPYMVPGHYVLLEVEDNGPGIPEETRQRIFEPFFTTKSKGTGLGLATVYGITKNHYGFVHVYSEKDSGTNFKIYLPIAGDAEASKVEDTQLEEMAAASEGGEKILILDDEEAVLESTKRMLERKGYQVIAMQNGNKAMEKLKEHKDVALVVLDYMMPGTSGLELFREINMVAPELKVLVSSGYSLNERIQQLLDEGADGFIQKPYSSEFLGAKIRSLLAQDAGKGQ